MGRFDGKAALVTGGASGIGRASAERLVEEGARVLVVDRDADQGAKLAAGLGGHFVEADVADPAAWPAVVDAVEQHLGGLDVAHLNAGVTTGQSDVTALTDDQYRRIMGVNVDGVVFGVRALVPVLERSGGGAVVATASLAGLVAFAGDPVYTLTKHAVVGFVRALAPQLEAKGITINAVCPGIVETPLVGEEATARLKEAGFPLIPPGQIAEAVVYAVDTGQTGQAWCCQPGREAEAFRFGQVPGPRTPGAEGRRPPGM